MEEQFSLLMVEDSEVLSELYKSFLADSPYEVHSVYTVAAAAEAFNKYKPQIVLLDIRLPDGNGLDFLQTIVATPEPPEVIVMTAQDTGVSADTAINLGALDFLTKPFDASRLRVTLNNACRRIKLAQRAELLSQYERTSYAKFIGGSLPMQAVYKTLESLAATDASAFILGESGTGKELAAEAIHAYSKRSKQAFMAINCGAIPSELMQSELFGHVKGAFTGASSGRVGAAALTNGGTLFLDEICEMSLSLQKKLLRFIQTGTFNKVGSDKLQKVDVRFICATNKDPLREVTAGRFREDLFYRLHVVPLRMPPLRERGEDIITLAKSFLTRYSERDSKKFDGLSDDVKRAFLRYPWPGNVRQLQNVIQQIVVLNNGGLVEERMLPNFLIEGLIEQSSEPLHGSLNSTRHNSDYMLPRDNIQPLWLLEKQAIESAIKACGGNINKAAGLLEVAPSTLYRKMRAWEDKTA